MSCSVASFNLVTRAHKHTNTHKHTHTFEACTSTILPPPIGDNRALLGGASTYQGAGNGVAVLYEGESMPQSSRNITEVSAHSSVVLNERTTTKKVGY